MSLQEQFEKLQNFDISELDPENIGGWPLAVKMVLWVVVFIAVVVASHQLVLKEKALELETDVQTEVKLKAEFEQKVQEAANIEKYREQMVEMERSFSALLSQLPKDTEVPGLLDDITNKGLDSGLSFQAIDLKKETKAEFYVELPIDVKVVGGYHDFGTFVSGVAGLPRIVTLHNFLIVKSTKDKATGKDADAAQNSDELSMTITAKTYRYKTEADAEPVQAKPKAAPAPAAGSGGHGG